MKTAKKLWQDGLRPGELGATMPDWFVQVIDKRDEEMRQECSKALSRTKLWYGEHMAAVLNAGKPQFKKGQLCFCDKKQAIRVVGYQGNQPGKLWRPVKWSDIVDDQGISLVGYRHTIDGPVFLRVAMSCD